MCSWRKVRGALTPKLQLLSSTCTLPLVLCWWLCCWSGASHAMRVSCPQEDSAAVCEAPGRDGIWCSQHLRRQHRGNPSPIKQVALEEKKRIWGINVLLAAFAPSYFSFYLSPSQGWVRLGCASDHLLCKPSEKAESTACAPLSFLPVLYYTLHFAIFLKPSELMLFFFPFPLSLVLYGAEPADAAKHPQVEGP